MKAKLGSLFDGIGGFPLSGLWHGITPVWASEIEPFPIKVTQIRFPSMKHVGDITKMNGADIEAVDIIAGGSPCQDLSIAGKRAGLEGARSGLFIEQIRIIKEARAKYGKPRFMVWENVPGAFSSANGEDFRAVIEETARIAESGVSIPRPAEGKWDNAGCILADTWSIAWRVLDAQFWGVPQRRRRIFLVADFGGQSAPEILFERKSVSGDTAEGGKAWQGAANGAESGAGSAIAFDGYNFATNEVNQTCRAGAGDQVGYVMTASFEPGAITRDMGIRSWEEVCPTLRAEAFDNQPAIYCLQGNGIDRPAVASPLTLQMRDGKAGGGKGPLTQIEQSASLTSVAQTLFQPKAYCAGAFSTYEEGFGPLRVSKGQEPLAVTNAYAVRRLTPTECERLQGFPDGWTDIEGASDSARYKALGNSVAIPCVEFVMQGIARELKEGDR